MRNTLVKSVFFIIGLIFLCPENKAFDVRGYIINEHSDTIVGTIKLLEYNQITGYYIFNGFDLESLNYKVYFKTDSEKKYHVFSPEKILGFGFNYHFEDYIFQRFLLEYKSIVKRERQKLRFLYLIHNGNIKLYQNTTFVLNPPNNSASKAYTCFYELYLFNNRKGLIRVEINKTTSVRKLLEMYEVNDKFIQEIPENVKLDDLKEILDRYDKWQSAQAPVTIGS